MDLSLNALQSKINDIQGLIGTFLTLIPKLKDSEQYIQAFPELVSTEKSLFNTVDATQTKVYALLPKLADIQSGIAPGLSDIPLLLAQIGNIYVEMQKETLDCKTYFADVKLKTGHDITLDIGFNLDIQTVILAGTALTAIYFMFIRKR